MDELSDNIKDPTKPPPVPLIRKRRTQKTAEQLSTTAEHEASTSSTVFIKTVKSSTTKEIHEESYSEESCSSSSTNLGQSLREKVAKYESCWSKGGSNGGITQDIETENPFDIDVFEIEKRLRAERKRGLAEAEAAKLAFQQIQLRATESPPKRVEINETHTSSPFNVTLKTTTKLFDETIPTTTPISPFNVTLRTTTQRQNTKSNDKPENVNNSPFNVTLRTTSTPISIRDDKLASAQFLANEKTVREIQSVDGVRTIITSSMTSDGSSHEEKIFRHGEGYFTPQRENSQPRSLSSISSGRSSATPPRSIDMTAGGRKILIRLEDEKYTSVDENDSASCMRRQFQTKTADLGVDSGVAMGTYDNIDIKVGSFNKHHDIDEIPWRNSKTVKTTMTMTNEKRTHETSKEIETSSIKFTGQLLGSTTAESRHIATPTYTHATTSKIHISGDRSDITDDSDTEGISASELIIVPINYELQQQQKENLAKNNTNNISASTGNSVLSKSPQQQQQQQNTNSNEYQEFQSSMAARNYTRSNSQYDSHIKELRGK